MDDMTSTMRDRRYRLVPAACVSRPGEWSSDQTAALEASGRAHLVVGGPGTGKTAVLVEAVARRVESGTLLDRLVVLTHARPAAQALRADLVRRLGGAHLAPRVTTVHGLALAIMQAHADAGLWSDLTLLRAPEQEFRLRELLAGHDVSGWPPELAAASGTRVFAGQLRGVLARARQVGLDPSDLGGFADVDPLWGAVGEFFDEYLTVLDFEGTLDYAELVHRARLVLTDESVRRAVGADIVGVYCDEFAELDDSQLGLLGDLVGAGASLMAVADPQQAVFGFRGPSGGATAWFAERFADGERVELTRQHRAGGVLAAAWASVASRLDARGAAQASGGGPGGGVVEAFVFDDPAAELSHVAERLREAHLRDGLGWGECAVIARSGRRELAPIARALRQFGVPVEVAGDEIALAEQPAVRPLLVALAHVLSDESASDADEAHRLLTSPLAALTPLELRGLARASGTTTWQDLIAEGAVVPDGEVGDRVRRLGRLLAGGRALVARGATVHQVLWSFWAGTDWPDRLRESALNGDLRAGGDLDAVRELFDLAASGQQLSGERGGRAFISEIGGQTIPADTGRESDPRGRGVRVLTAHRAKGLSFRRVFVVGLQEGNWPRLIRRGGLLEPELLGRDGPSVTPPPGRIAAERRLFLVAISRASEQLWVSGCRGAEGEGERPSRFLAELGVPVERVHGRATRPLSIAGLVAELRRVASDPGADAALRQAAAVRLARLAGASDRAGRPVAPHADPARWWGMAERTGGWRREGVLRLSGTDVGSVIACPRRWFLARRAAGDTLVTSAAELGRVVHALAQRALQDGLTRGAASDELDRMWHGIGFEAAWLSGSERAAAEEAIERLYGWLDAHEGADVLGVEVPFSVPVRVGGVDVDLVGVVDRLELDARGRLRIIDFKTGRSVPDARSVATHEQLGAYQLAARLGAFEAVAPGVRAVGDAELVFLRGQDGPTPYPKVLRQPSLDDVPGDSVGDTWVHDVLGEAVDIIASERFEARVGDTCRFCAFRRGCPARQEGSGVVS